MLHQCQLMLLYMSTQGYVKGVIWRWMKLSYPFFLDKMYACVSSKNVRVMHIFCCFCCFIWQVAYPVKQNLTQLDHIMRDQLQHQLNIIKVGLETSTSTYTYAIKVALSLHLVQFINWYVRRYKRFKKRMAHAVYYTEVVVQAECLCQHLDTRTVMNESIVSV